jgi:hypothetical protein
MFQKRRTEELYDTEADPFEMNNLADDPDYSDDLKRLSDALDSWLHQVGDMGRIPESEMVRQWYPNGEQPQTAAPIAVPICEESPGIDAELQGKQFKSPLLVQLHCATQGASMAYALGEGEDTRWLLYSAPLPFEPGTQTLRAKAIRVGYKESNELSITFTVT